MNLTGDYLSNTLTGGDGDDTLSGLGGYDWLIGGAGNDTYIVPDLQSWIHEQNGTSGGIDTLVSKYSNLTLESSSIENLTMTGSWQGNLTGNAGDNYLKGNSGANLIIGGAGNDTLEGGDNVWAYGYSIVSMTSTPDDGLVLASRKVSKLESGTANVILAMYSANRAKGLGGIITGGNGGYSAGGYNLSYSATFSVTSIGSGILVFNPTIPADTLQGGTGDDVYIYTGTATRIIEEAKEGNDAVISSRSVFLTNFENIENAWLGTSGAVVEGNSLANILGSRPGFGSNSIWGGGGNDTLVAGPGDTLAGGLGNDVYDLTGLSPAGLLTVRFGENSGQGSDTVIAGREFTLPDGVEIGVWGGSGPAVLHGNSLKNRLNGTEGSDTLFSDSPGAASSDTLVGGAGDDVYVLDSTFAKIIEARGTAGGIDTVVVVNHGFSIETYANVENLTMTGTGGGGPLTGNSLGNYLKGNAGTNLINGGGGSDTLDGGGASFGLLRLIAPPDLWSAGSPLTTIQINSGTLTFSPDFVAPHRLHIIIGDREFFFEEGEPVIIPPLDTNSRNTRGSSGIVVQGAGSVVLWGDRFVMNSPNLTILGHDLNITQNFDTLAGGAGDDFYIYDPDSKIVEAAGGGSDTIVTGTSLSLASFKNVENMLLTAGGLTARGNSGANILTSGEYDRSNVLIGDAGNDTLAAGSGDTLIGGENSDVYDLTNLDANELDSVIISEDFSGRGTDTVLIAFGDFTLKYGIENGGIAGSTGAVLRGNDVANRLTGGAGSDTLTSVGSDDTLAGGAGHDVYIIGTSPVKIIESGGTRGGRDSVYSPGNFTLPASVEDLYLTGAARKGTGNGSDNEITGNSLNNILSGGDGDDVLNGGASTGAQIDTLTGGAGSDVFVLRRHDVDSSDFHETLNDYVIITDFNSNDDYYLTDGTSRYLLPSKVVISDSGGFSVSFRFGESPFPQNLNQLGLGTFGPKDRGVYLDLDHDGTFSRGDDFVAILRSAGGPPLTNMPV